MTKVSAEISNKDVKGKITLENIEEKFEEIEEGMHVRLKNGTERELPVNKAVEEIWGMVYEIKNATEVLVDINKTYQTFKKYRKPIAIICVLGLAFWFGIDLKHLLFKWFGLS